MIAWHLHHRHEGVENAISGPDLRDWAGYRNLRELQARVEFEREQGHPICSAPGVGYWWPRDRADAERCLRWLRDMGAKHYRDAGYIEDALTVDGQVAMF